MFLVTKMVNSKFPERVVCRTFQGSKTASKTQYEIHSFEYLSFISKLCVYIKNKKCGKF